MEYKLNLLLVCARNKRRSRTAEFIFKNDSRFNIRSAGLSDKSDHKITQNDVQWADLILVMEDDQKNRIREIFRKLALPPLDVLNIDDDYEYLDVELVGLLTEGINNVLMLYYKL